MDRLLLVDDDKELCEMLHNYLKNEGFSIDTVYDGRTAIERVLNGDYHLVILDIMLPELSGFEVLKIVREQSLVAVLVLTARDEDVDSVVGLELGADDYLVKPCNPRVLVARIRAILRRSQTDMAASPGHRQQKEEKIQVGSIRLYPQSRRIYRGESPVPLTSAEFSILEQLMRNAGSVVPKKALSEQALGRKLSHFDRSIDMHISNVRKKLEFISDDIDTIKTIRNVGYLFSK